MPETLDPAEGLRPADLPERDDRLADDVVIRLPIEQAPEGGHGRLGPQAPQDADGHHPVLTHGMTDGEDQLLLVRKTVEILEEIPAVRASQIRLRDFLPASGAEKMCGHHPIQVESIVSAWTPYHVFSRVAIPPCMVRENPPLRFWQLRTKAAQGSR